MRNSAKELETLLTAHMCAYTSVSLINHNEPRTSAGKAVAALVRLDIGETDPVYGCASKSVCDAGRPRSNRAAEEAVTAAASRSNFVLSLAGPLFNQMRRTQDGKSIDLPTIDKLA